MDSHAKKDPNHYQNILQGILDKEKKKQTNDKMKLVGSWVILLLILMIVFSGIEINIFGGQFSFIKLDSNFITGFAPYISKGIVQTILISIISIFFAMVLALLSALARLSKVPPLVAISTFYVSLIRGTPLYLQVIFFFMALPQLKIVMPGFWAGVTALSLNYGAYMSEIFRAGILSVGKGQHEAATALGMNSGQKMRYIVLPQALRLAIPPIGNEFIAMLKDSSLVSVTGFVHEILWRAQKVGRANFRSLEALLIAAILYWGLTLIFTALQARVEAKFGESEGQIKTAPH